MIRLLSENVGAVFALLGVIAGAALTFVGTWLLKTRELRLRLWEKVLDRRIEAHEQIVQLSKDLRTMASLGRCNKEGNLIRAPGILLSKDIFENWFAHYTQTCNRSSTWLSTELTRELNLIQDYIVNLHVFLSEIDSDKYFATGTILRDDFIAFSQRIEKLAFDFFHHDLYKLRLNKLEDWHKYPIEDTEARLNNTAFFARFEEIANLLSNSEDD